jgi:hypothetical protein
MTGGEAKMESELIKLQHDLAEQIGDIAWQLQVIVNKLEDFNLAIIVAQAAECEHD